MDHEFVLPERHAPRDDQNMSFSNSASLHIIQDRGPVCTNLLLGHENLLGHQTFLHFLTEDDLQSVLLDQSATGLSAYNRIEQLWATLVRIGEGADEGEEEGKGRGG